MYNLSIVSTIAILISGTQASKKCNSCPPKDLDAKKDLCLTSFISAPWYAVKQMPVRYQPLESFYCVKAEYTLKKKPWYQIGSTLNLKVENYATTGVNGKVRGGELSAKVRDPKNTASKLKVGPKFLPTIAYGDYWVMAAGTYEDVLAKSTTPFAGTTYEWAIISGGAPKNSSNGKCITGTGTNGSGFWMFTRDPLPPVGVIEAVEQVASNLGYDVSQWKLVEQKGCTYQK